MANCNKKQNGRNFSNRNVQFPPRNVEQVSKELCSLVLWAPPKLQCVFVFPENYNKMMMFSMLLREIRKVLLS